MKSGNGASRRAGSHFSDKQIFRSVKDGKPVRVVLPDGQDLTGWVCGMDDYHWGLVDLTGAVHLIHKSVPAISILRDEDAEVPAFIQKVVRSFRDYVMNTHFGQSVAQGR